MLFINAYFDDTMLSLQLLLNCSIMNRYRELAGRYIEGGFVTMYIENTGIENIVADLSVLDEIMLKHDLVRAGQWDYERVTYDKKYVIKEGTFLFTYFWLYN